MKGAHRNFGNKRALRLAKLQAEKDARLAKLASLGVKIIKAA